MSLRRKTKLKPRTTSCEPVFFEVGYQQQQQQQNEEPCYKKRCRNCDKENLPPNRLGSGGDEEVKCQKSIGLHSESEIDLTCVEKLQESPCIQTFFKNPIESTQFCMNCYKFFCFCTTSINIHTEKEIALTCFEKLQESPHEDASSMLHCSNKR